MLILMNFCNVLDLSEERRFRDDVRGGIISDSSASQVSDLASFGAESLRPLRKSSYGYCRAEQRRSHSNYSEKIWRRGSAWPWHSCSTFSRPCDTTSSREFVFSGITEI